VIGQAGPVTIVADEAGGAALDAAAYLRRLGYGGPTRPAATTLAGLHLAHLRAVPFENLDIARGQPISLQIADLFDKIVRRRRGGFCYELNGLFAALLRQLAFQVTLLGAVFPRPPGLVAPELDHLALLVADPEGAGSWLADVGAGRGSAAAPLPFVTGQDHFDPVTGAWFRLEPEAGGLRLLRQDGAGPTPDVWAREYLLSDQPRTLDEFTAGADYHQTSPDSPFTRDRICSLLTANGRVTLSGSRLIATVNGVRHERELANEHEVRTVLRDQFGIDDLDI